MYCDGKQGYTQAVGTFGEESIRVEMMQAMEEVMEGPEMRHDGTA